MKRTITILLSAVLLMPWFHSPTQAQTVRLPIPEIGRPLPTPLEMMKPLPVIELKPIEPLPYIAVEAPKAKPQTPVAPRGTVPGNTYTAGNCTWYVKSKRPDLPNNLGNADTWTIRALNQGLPTGKVPRPGAVGQLGMHVVLVESVHGNQMTISEMNYQGLGIVSSRTVPWQGWNFIY